jgi:hypothetical protein
MGGFRRMTKSQDEAKRHQGIDRDGGHDHINSVALIAV